MFAGHNEGRLALPICVINAELLGLLRTVCHDCGLKNELHQVKMASRCATHGARE